LTIVIGSILSKLEQMYVRKFIIPNFLEHYFFALIFVSVNAIHMKPFKSIIDFQRVFGTDEACRLYLEEQRWGGTPACPHCGSINVCRFANGSGIFKCREKQCRKKFSVTCKTVYQDRKLPLHKIFLAIYVLGTHSKGISSLQLANLLDISQPAAWLLNHKVRAMLAENDPEALTDLVEADETWVGGSIKNKHNNQKRTRDLRIQNKQRKAEGQPPLKRLAPGDNKTMVAGMVQRGGKVIARVVPNVKGGTLQLFVRKNVKEGATLYTDEWGGYKRLGKFYTHESVNHKLGEYVRGSAHTGTIDGYWSLLKRQIDGIHHSVSPKHLQRYVHEASFRYNHRKDTQDIRFAEALKNCNGSLQYKQLIQ